MKVLINLLVDGSTLILKVTSPLCLANMFYAQTIVIRLQPLAKNCVFVLPCKHRICR